MGPMSLSGSGEESPSVGETWDFSQGRGTLDQLYILVRVLDGGMVQPVHMYYVDLAMAYDCVPQGILCLVNTLLVHLESPLC